MTELMTEPTVLRAGHRVKMRTRSFMRVVLTSSAGLLRLAMIESVGAGVLHGSFSGAWSALLQRGIPCTVQGRRLVRARCALNILKRLPFCAGKPAGLEPMRAVFRL